MILGRFMMLASNCAGSVRVASISAASLALALTAPASAETLPVAGFYPAGNDDAAALQSIAIEDFSGDRGTALSFAVTDALQNAAVYGERYFDIFPLESANADAVLRGFANAEIVEIDLEDRKLVECMKKDDDKKCIDEKVTLYACSRLEVSVFPQIRLIRADGQQIYSKRDRLNTSADYCANDSQIPSAEAMAGGLIETFARSVRFDLVPHYSSRTYRILESRKGLKKGDSRAFRSAVRMTKTDVAGACAEFTALEEAYPQHVSILFNIGLCAEGAGDLERAASYYNRALAEEPGKDYPTDGLRRIAQRERANAQLDMHYGPLEQDAPDNDAAPETVANPNAI